MWGRSIDEMAVRVKNLGLSGIELWAEQVWHSQMQTREIVQAIRQNELEASLHAASWDLNLCALNEGVRRQSVEEIHRSIKLAVAIGAKNVTVHPGKRTLTADWTEWHAECLQESLSQIEEIAKTYETTVSVELMEEVKKEFMTEPHELNRLIEPYSELIQTTFDAAHISLGKNIIDAFNQLNRVNHIHLSDSTATKYHVALGEGELDLGPFIEYIKNTSYTVVLEGYDSSEDACLLHKHLNYVNLCLQQTREEMNS
jgi:sugar phosphate isomerase/epimerase